VVLCPGPRGKKPKGWERSIGPIVPPRVRKPLLDIAKGAIGGLRDDVWRVGGGDGEGPTVEAEDGQKARKTSDAGLCEFN
jgi:hypothetical protein